MKWSLADCEVVGGMRPASGKAPFARGAAVLGRRADSASFLHVHEYTEEGAEGEPLQTEEWQDLRSSGQALLLQAPVIAEPHAALWVFRPGYEERQQDLDTLAQQRALMARELLDPAEPVVAIVREQIGNPLRDGFAERQYQRAWECARAARWADALRHADLAFVLSRGLMVERVALLSLALEQQGRKTGSDGLIEMAVGSRGAQFGQRVREKRAELAQQCLDAARAPVPTRAEPRSARQSMYKARARHLRASSGARVAA